MSQTEGNAPMNTTQPDALPREQRDSKKLDLTSDPRLWQWHECSKGKAVIIDAQGFTVLGSKIGISQAIELVAQHNHLIRQLLATA
jgi:hypothetical protein